MFQSVMAGLPLPASMGPEYEDDAGLLALERSRTKGGGRGGGGGRARGRGRGGGVAAPVAAPAAANPKRMPARRRRRNRSSSVESETAGPLASQAIASTDTEPMAMVPAATPSRASASQAVPADAIPAKAMSAKAKAKAGPLACSNEDLLRHAKVELKKRKKSK